MIDLRLLREVGAGIDESKAQKHDSETYETTVPNFCHRRVRTGKQSGKIFIENGRFHGEVVVVRSLRQGPPR
jgi:hypothetical protein